MSKFQIELPVLWGDQDAFAHALYFNALELLLQLFGLLVHLRADDGAHGSASGSTDDDAGANPN